MSTDYAFWKAGGGPDAGDTFDRLADGDAADLIASPDLLRFRQGLLTRWPELVDYLEPRAAGENESKYGLLTLGGSVLHVIPAVLEMARAHELNGFSGMDDAAIQSPGSAGLTAWSDAGSADPAGEGFESGFGDEGVDEAGGQGEVGGVEFGEVGQAVAEGVVAGAVGSAGCFLDEQVVVGDVEGSGGRRGVRLRQGGVRA